MSNEDLSNREGGLEQSPEDMMLGFLDSEERATEETGTPEPEEETEGESEDNLEEGSEEEEEVEDSDEEDTEDFEEVEDEGETEDDSEEAELFEITIGDQTQDVTLDELSKGYMLNADYTKKTQALAEDRKAIETAQGEITQLRANLVSQMESFKSADQVALAELDKTNWEELKVLDPETYIEKQALRSEITSRIEQAEKDQTALAQQQLEDNTKAFNEAKAKANEVLLSEEHGIPGWGDEEKFPQIQKDLRETGLSLGYTEEELAYAIDPRALKALWLASQAMKTQEAEPRIKAKLKKKVPKVSKPSAKRKKTSVAKQQKLKNKARQTGRPEDAAAAIFDLLGDD